MKWTHKISEALARKATERKLWPWERGFLQAHLASCPVCFKDALALAAMLHEGGEPGLPKKDLARLHQRVMIRVRQESAREQEESRLLALKHPRVSPLFFPALGAAALILVFLTLLTSPPNTGDLATGPAGPAQVSTRMVLPALPTPTRVPVSPAPATSTAAPVSPTAVVVTPAPAR